MLRNLSLTQRVIWAVTATVALLVGLQTVLAYVAMHVQEDEMADALLEHEVRQLVAYALEPGMTPAGALRSSQNFSAYLTRGDEGMQSLPADVHGLAPGLYWLNASGLERHVAVADTDDGRLTVILDATASEARVMHFGWTLLGLWIICVAATVWIARGVATLAVGPIVAATRLIAGWSPAPAPGGPASRDEAVVLMETFNQFRDRMDDSVAREREFAANLDHEIRTPLTAIRTNAELLGVDGPLTPAQGQRLQRIVGSVDEIIATAEETRLTSAGGLGAPERVSLRECVQSASDSMAQRAIDSGLVIHNAIGPDEFVAVDRQALLTVARNIVRNAVEHAAPATLTVSNDAHGLHFEDDGPGVPASTLPHIFERYHAGRRDDSGRTVARGRRGLGLAIARRLCDMNGWALTAHSPCRVGRRGTRFSLRLSARTDSTFPRQSFDESATNSRVA